MALYGMITAVVSFFIAFIAEVIIAVVLSTESTGSSDLRYYTLAGIAWIAFNAKPLIALIRLKTSGAHVENKKNTMRVVELSVTGFVWLYALFFHFFPYEGNADPDSLNKFFAMIIAILSVYRVLTISMFIRITKALDYGIIAFMIITLISKGITP